jgi:hypothetical protein
MMQPPLRTMQHLYIARLQLSSPVEDHPGDLAN